MLIARLVEIHVVRHVLYAVADRALKLPRRTVVWWMWLIPQGVQLAGWHADLILEEHIRFVCT